MSQPRPKNPATGRPRIRQTLYGNWYGYRSDYATAVGHDFKIEYFKTEKQAREWLNKQLATSKNK